MARSVAGATVAIVGAGAVGQSVGRLLAQAGFRVCGVASRTLASARRGVAFIGQGRAVHSPAKAAAGAEVVLIATPDTAIRDVCDGMAAAGAFASGMKVFHFSGALGAAELASARDAGAAVAALHPLQSIPSPGEGIRRLPGTVFSFEGDPGAKTMAKRMVKALGGEMIEIPGSAKALYHAACCVLSNYAVAVADLGLAMLLRALGEAGAQPEEALAAAMPLMRGTLDNIAKLGPVAALTGPIARGDASTVTRHLAAMDGLPPRMIRLYRELGMLTLDLAQRKRRMAPSEVDKLRKALAKGKKG
ncbi:MAG TPA: DUF2520 domain-containing protein [Candidatus Brocadiia bacterium]|nr:DUF2520 domain-containing protein [Candidatus Brocadiia bacterium]